MTIPAEKHRAVAEAFRSVWAQQAGALKLPPTAPNHALVLALSVSATETSHASPEAWAKNGDDPRLLSSNNYGGIQCNKTEGCDSEICAPGSDSFVDGKRYFQCFRIYATPAEGIADLLAHLVGASHPLTRAAMLDDSASVHDVAAAMHAEHYFGGWCPIAIRQYGNAAAAGVGIAGAACSEEAIAAYAAKMQEHADAISSALGTPKLAAERTPPLWPYAVAVAVALAAAGAYYWWTHREPKKPLALRSNNDDAAEWADELYERSLRDEEPTAPIKPNPWARPRRPAAAGARRRPAQPPAGSGRRRARAL